MGWRYIFLGKREKRETTRGSQDGSISILPPFDTCGFSNTKTKVFPPCCNVQVFSCKDPRSGRSLGGSKPFWDPILVGR